MRIEVLVQDENPVFYDLNKPRLTLGSDVSCDIIVTHGDVSRQHLVIINENENFFVMDRGSTNGTYLNEERLIPGRRVEFNSFFPVRLGTDVLISLVSDDEGEVEEPKKISIPIPTGTNPSIQKPPANEATRVVSIKDLKAAKTETLAKKRAEIKKKTDPAKAAPAKKKKAGFKPNKTHFMVLGIMAVALYLNNPFKAKPKPVEKPIPVADETGKVKKNDAVVIQTAKKRERPAGESIFGLFTSYAPQSKCQSEKEQSLCPIMDYSEYPYGVKELEKEFLVFVPEGRFVNEAVKYLNAYKQLKGQRQEFMGAAPPAMGAPPKNVPPPSSVPAQPMKAPEAIQMTNTPSNTMSGRDEKTFQASQKVEPVYDTTIPTDFEDKDVYRVAMALFVAEVSSRGINFNNFGDKGILVGLMKKEDSGSLRLMAAIEITPEKLSALKYLITGRRLEAIKESGVRVIDFTDEHYPFFFGQELGQ